MASSEQLCKTVKPLLFFQDVRVFFVKCGVVDSQVWGEIARLPEMWLWFDFCPESHTCVEFVVGSRLAVRVFLLCRQFFFLLKT